MDYSLYKLDMKGQSIMSVCSDLVSYRLKGTDLDDSLDLVSWSSCSAKLQH